MADWSDIQFNAGQTDYITRLNALLSRAQNFATEVENGRLGSPSLQTQINTRLNQTEVDARIVALAPTYVAGLTQNFGRETLGKDVGLSVGATRRRLSFFLMVLAYSRRLYVEFTLAQSMEHFLACHQQAFAYFGGVTAEVMVDNCKTAVLAHPVGGPATLHPRYLDLAQHYGFTIRPCAPRQPQQKGRVESAVAYVKKNFLAGLEILSFEPINPAGRRVTVDLSLLSIVDADEPRPGVQSCDAPPLLMLFQRRRCRPRGRR
ncbi:MAG: transposase [Aquincola sp.]|nr:transposase [Aquincola sp.]